MHAVKALEDTQTVVFSLPVRVYTSQLTVPEAPSTPAVAKRDAQPKSRTLTCARRIM